jgi:pimeloyl-ACP methyl ester carboxylesterase
MAALRRNSSGELWHSTSGSGEYLVLLHGMGSAHTAWKLITPELEKNFTVIVVDLPGHGHTPYMRGEAMDPISLAEKVSQTLSDSGIEKFHLVGNSLGGWVALELAAKYSDRVLSVTALAPAGLWLVPETRRLWRAAQGRQLAKVLHPIAPQIARFERAKKIGFELVSPEWRSLPVETCVDATIAMGKSKGYFPAWDALLGRRFDSDVSSSIPVTIVFGDSDNTLPAAFSQERSLAPHHAKWVTLTNSGHAPMWDRTSDVIALIKETAAANSGAN